MFLLVKTSIYLFMFFFIQTFDGSRSCPYDTHGISFLHGG